MKAEYRLTEEQLYEMCTEFHYAFTPDDGASRSDYWKFIYAHLEELE